jgi:hypothetical protein
VALAGVACLVAGALVAEPRKVARACFTPPTASASASAWGLVYVPSVGAVQPWFSRQPLRSPRGSRSPASAPAISPAALAAWWIALFGWRGAYLALALFVLHPRGSAAAAIKERARAPPVPLDVTLARR